MLISVIVPIYNVEKYIRRCIDSIVSQTYKNLEIILVDDGSPDKCPQICDEYAKKDNRIIVLHKENSGLSDARNAGLDIAKGEYFIFIDSDDYVTENFVDVLYMTASQNGSKLAICNHVCVDESGNHISVKNDSYVKNEIISAKEINGRVMQFSTHMCVVAWNKIYHRSLWENIRYPRGRVCEDEYVFCDIVDQCDKIACSASHEYYYRVRKSSIMSNGNFKLYYDMIHASKKRIIYYRKKEWLDLVEQGYILSMLDAMMMCYCHCHTCEEKRWYKEVLEEINLYISSHGVLEHMTFKEKIKLLGCNYFPRLLNQLGLLDLKIHGNNL